MIKCCIFDLDGTVLDTINSITYFVNYALERYGIEKITVDECKYLAGNGVKDLIKRTLASRGINDEALYNEILPYYIDAYDANPWHLTAPFDGIIPLLKELKAHGIKIAVVSNKPDSTVKIIVPHFFGDIFDAVSGIREGMKVKPDPSVALGILDTFGISASETAWVGDTSTDMETGKNLGAALKIGVLWGFRKRDELEGAGADLVVSRADEILAEVTSRG